jgi:hypothetical protein
MDLKPFQKYQLVPPHTPCEHLDPDEEVYFAVGIWAGDADDAIASSPGPPNLLVEVYLLPLRGRDPTEAVTAVAINDIQLGMWSDSWLKVGEPAHIDHLASAVATVERWLRESQLHDDLRAVELPEGFHLDIHLYVTDCNDWMHTPGSSAPLGEWWLMEGAHGEIISLGGSDPVAELVDPCNEFSEAYVAAWTGSLAVAREMVKEFLANEMQVSEMLARIEPEVQRRPILMDLTPIAQMQSVGSASQ